MAIFRFFNCCILWAKCLAPAGNPTAVPLFPARSTVTVSAELPHSRKLKKHMFSVFFYKHIWSFYRYKASHKTLFRNFFIKYKIHSKSVYPLSSVFVLTDGHRGRFNVRFAGMLMTKPEFAAMLLWYWLGGRDPDTPCNVKPEEHTLCGTAGAKLRAR
jgi:hypothetical protein